MFAIKICRSKRNPFLRSCAREIIFGKIWAIVRQKFICADQRDRPLVTFAPQHFRRGTASCARTDDHHTRRRAFRFARRLLVYLASYEKTVAAFLDFPARNVAQRRRAYCFASAQIKASVVPRTAHRAIHHQTLCQWPAVMRASRANSENFFAASGCQNCFSKCVSQKHFPVRQFVDLASLFEIRALQLA